MELTCLAKPSIWWSRKLNSFSLLSSNSAETMFLAFIDWLHWAILLYVFTVGLLLPFVAETDSGVPPFLRFRVLGDWSLVHRVRLASTIVANFNIFSCPWKKFQCEQVLLYMQASKSYRMEPSPLFGDGILRLEGFTSLNILEVSALPSSLWSFRCRRRFSFSTRELLRLEYGLRLLLLDLWVAESKGHLSIELDGDPYHEDVGVDWQEFSTSVLLAFVVFINGGVEDEPVRSMFEPWELTFLPKVISDGGRRVVDRDDLSDWVEPWMELKDCLIKHGFFNFPKPSAVRKENHRYVIMNFISAKKPKLLHMSLTSIELMHTWCRNPRPAFKFDMLFT